MARRKKAETSEPVAGDPGPDAAFQSQIFSGGTSLHDLFQQQARQVLEQSDLDEDAKQAILVAMNCPCCGAGGMNYTARIKRRS